MRGKMVMRETREKIKKANRESLAAVHTHTHTHTHTLIVLVK